MSEVSLLKNVIWNDCNNDSKPFAELMATLATQFSTFRNRKRVIVFRIFGTTNKQEKCSSFFSSLVCLSKNILIVKCALYELARLYTIRYCILQKR